MVKTFLAGLPLLAVWALAALLAGCFRFRDALDAEAAVGLAVVLAAVAVPASSVLAEKEDVPGMEASRSLSLSLDEAACPFAAVY